MKQSDIDKYDEQFDEELEKLDFDQYKVNRLCEQAAFKIAPLFNLYGITYGDKVPDVYFLAFNIKEMLMSVLTGDGNTASGGHFRITYNPDDELENITISFDLASLDRKELR